MEMNDLWMKEHCSVYDISYSYNKDKAFSSLLTSYPGDKSENLSKITGFTYPVRMRHTKFRCGWV